MSNQSSATGYARLTPFQARAVLASVALTAAVLLTLTLSSPACGPSQKKSPGAGDIALYWAEVARIRAGEGYYQAAAAELTARGYPTRSVFNWRTPLPMWLLGRLPDPWFGKAILGLLAGALLVFSFEAVSRADGGRIRAAVLGAVLLTGSLAFCVLDDLFVAPCLWSGVLIGLSLCAYGLGRPGWGVIAGVTALFFRELALPYCVLALGLACHQRQWRQAAAWTLGILAWLVFFGLHWMQVTPLISPGARAHTHGWVQFGGAAFVVATAQMNAYLLLLPQWVAALYFTAAMFGFAGWRAPLGQRAGLTAALFVVAFGIVGQEFNQYWGSMLAPLWCLGAARFPASLADLWRAAWKGSGVGVRSSVVRIPE